MAYNLNISETSGNFSQEGGNSLHHWVIDADFSNLTVTGDFDIDQEQDRIGEGEADSYSFTGLSTSAYGSLSGNTATGEFTFTIDKAAVIASGTDQTVEFTVIGKYGRYQDDDKVTINIAICVQRGTLIKTAQGPVMVEDLRQGTRVKTLDSGYQPVRWIGSRRLGPADFLREPELRPIRIKAGALEPGSPERDLLVSPQHRVLVSGWKAELYFGQPEVLVPAKALVNDHDICIAHDMEDVEYFHVLFDRHEIMLTNGALTESFFPGTYALGDLDHAVRQELHAIFPHLDNDLTRFGPPARPSVRPNEAAILRQGGMR